jgi:ABC-2 type transport system ATP-binding protein
MPGPPTGEAVIETHGLTKTFGEVTAVQSLDLTVPRHSIVGFLGPNGAGKTVTTKLLLDLIRPTSGGGTIFGMDIVRDSLEIRRRVGYLAQHPRFYATMTPRETLRFTARFFYDGPSASIERRVNEVLEWVDLADKADRPIRGFSGGEMQRLGIAQAQINEPDLLILDEPAAALDPTGRYAVLRIMERLREQTTIFYSTHILDDVQRVSDRAIILNHGQLVTQGPIETLLAGDEGSVYEVELLGDTEAARQRVEGQPWVADLIANRVNGGAKWRVAVTDEERARKELLRLILDGDIEVLRYGREEHELEQVFMDLVQDKETPS